MNAITTAGTPARLPAEVGRELLRLKESPERYYAVTTAERAADPREKGALTVSAINRGLGRDYAMMALAIAIKEVRDFFNVKGNMTESQIALTAELILDSPTFYDLSLGNIKACFRHRMMTERVYDRIDGNLLITWLREFKAEMSESCYLARMEEDNREETGESGGISHAVYMEMLRQRAQSGDGEAAEILADYSARQPVTGNEERHRREMEFFRFKTEYEAKKKQKNHGNRTSRQG